MHHAFIFEAYRYNSLGRSFDNDQISFCQQKPHKCLNGLVGGGVDDEDAVADLVRAVDPVGRRDFALRHKSAKYVWPTNRAS